MKIGILETGLLREALIERFDPYPVMFERFLGLAGRELEFDSYSVLRGEMPPSVDACDGWLITGSRHGAYDPLEWIAPLEDFIRALEQANKPLIGVCFGHQIIAQALGGKVVKSDRGWGVGLHHYRIDRRTDWMLEAGDRVAMYVFHQDQVVDLPPRAEVFASSDFCPYAGLVYGDSIISVQGHPEFERSYMKALIDLYGESLLTPDVTDAARASMVDAHEDRQMLSDWFAEFLLAR
ncbi:MAG: type 1 glutamine amidotransferase [Gammaproteobacteria bacterium]|nr:type 1 glutamine amidotransferase [Gammaproteobacteria bacterium]